jgi:hypothetical protein
MTKKEFIESISNIQDDAIVSIAVFACGDVDLSNPNTAEIVQYVDSDMIKNVPDDLMDLHNLVKE